MLAYHFINNGKKEIQEKSILILWNTEVYQSFIYHQTHCCCIMILGRMIRGDSLSFSLHFLSLPTPNVEFDN